MQYPEKLTENKRNTAM